MSRAGVGVLFVLLLVGIGYGISRLGGSEPDRDAGATSDPGQAAHEPGPAPIVQPSAGVLLDGGPITKTIADRAVRDEVRRRILAAWASNPDPEVASAARDGRFVPIPEDRDASAHYIQSVVREEFFPMAKGCYHAFLERKDAGGRMLMKFKIVGDEKIGGVLDDVEVEMEGGIEEEELHTCMRESLLSLSFRPPPKDWITVEYPIELSP